MHLALACDAAPFLDFRQSSLKTRTHLFGLHVTCPQFARMLCTHLLQVLLTPLPARTVFVRPLPVHL